MKVLLLLGLVASFVSVEAKCSFKDRLSCLKKLKDLPTCTADEKVEAKDCCASCKPTKIPFCQNFPENACEQGKLPKFDTSTGCPSCVIKRCECKTPRDQIKECVAGEFPKRGDDCCLTCKMPTPQCTKENRDKCKETIKAGLLNCTDDQIPFDFETCCLTCTKSKFPKKADAKKCTLSEFKKERDEARACDSNEMPMFTGRCAPSCKRRERACSIEQVAECRANTTECAAGEEPEYAEGDCCRSCIKPKPKCSCDGKCIRDNPVAAGKCVGKKSIKLFIKAKKAVKKAFAKQATPQEVKEMLLEMAERFCQRPQNEAACDKYLQPLKDGLECLSSKAKEDGEEVTCEVPKEATTRRRLLDVDSFLTDVTTDADSTDEFEVTVGGGSPDDSAAARSAGSIVLGGALAAAALALMA